MRCQHCNYQIFAYSRCCPNCGRSVQPKAVVQNEVKVPQTRLDFWVAGLRKQLHIPTTVRRSAA